MTRGSTLPPGYRRLAALKRPKLDGFTGIIFGGLEGDREAQRKQRHTAKRVFGRLRPKHGLTGGYRILKDYLRKRERRGRALFVPLAHPPVMPKPTSARRGHQRQRHHSTGQYPGHVVWSARRDCCGLADR